MALKLTHRIVRELPLEVDGDPLIMTLEPYGVVGLRRKHQRETFYIPIEEIWTMASVQQSIKRLESKGRKKKKVLDPKSFKPVDLTLLSKLVTQYLQSSNEPRNIKAIRYAVEKAFKHPIAASALNNVLQDLKRQKTIKYIHPFRYEVRT